MTTKTSTWKFRIFMFYFFLCVRRGRYFAIYRFQNTDNIFSITFHFVEKLLTLSCEIEMLTFGLLLPLMKDSILVKYVANISAVNNESRTTVFSSFFVTLTIASIAPFIHSEASGLKFHLIRFAVSSL